MSAKCQYPTSGSRHDGTLRLCCAPVTHYFDFSTYSENGNHVSHRVVCLFHSSDPKGLYPGKTATIIGHSNPSFSLPTE